MQVRCPDEACLLRARLYGGPSVKRKLAATDAAGNRTRLRRTLRASGAPRPAR